MKKKILVTLDQTEISKELARIADAWAQRIDAELHFLHVGRSDVEDELQQNRLFNESLASMDIAAEYVCKYRIGTAYREILEQEKITQPELIIMGAHQHTRLGRLFLGSNTKYVLHHCESPVYIHKQQKLFFENKIVVPIDYSDVNKPVVRLADEWAQRTGAELYFIRVDESQQSSNDPIGMVKESGAEAERSVDAFKDEEEKTRKGVEQKEAKLQQYIASQNVQAPHQTVQKFGEPYLRILGLQEYINAGLIMMAAHSHTMLHRMIAGSNTDYLMHHATCPMYVYKAKE